MSETNDQLYEKAKEAIKAYKDQLNRLLGVKVF